MKEFVTRLRIRLLERSLRAGNATWRAHMESCTGCRLAATGNRQQRRAFRPKFCVEAQSMIPRLEDQAERLKRLYVELQKVSDNVSKPETGSPVAR